MRWGFDRSPEFHPDGNNFDRWRTIQGGFRTDWAESNRDTFTFQGDIYDEGAGESVGATYYTPPYQQVLDGTAHLSGGNVLGRWERTLGEGKDFQFQAYYDRTNRHEPNFEDLRDTFDVDFLDRFPLPGRQQVSWGLGARFSHGDNPPIISGLVFLPTERTDRLLTAFLQDEIGLVENRLTFTLGTKFLETNFTGWHLEPSGRLLWTPTKTQSVWASFTHALRTPSDAEENFYLLGPPIEKTPEGLLFARFNPNPGFRPEELNGYELGYRQLLSQKLYVDIAAFYNHYGDLFSEDLSGPPFVETTPPPTHVILPADFGNGLLGTTKGFEVAPEWKPLNFWRLGATYSYLQMDLKKSPTSPDIEPPAAIEGSSPRHQATAQSDFEFKKRFDFDFTFRYVSALPALSVDAYTTADSRLAWQCSRHFQLSVVGLNLFQPHHPEFGGEDPGPNVGIKRSVYGQVMWKQ